MNVIITHRAAAPTATLAESIATGRHLSAVKRDGLADNIGGFYEYTAMIGLTRQQADRLVKLAERVGVAV